MRKDTLLMGIDVGSTAVKVIAMTAAGDIRGSASSHYGADSPRPGWVEQNPEVWWGGVIRAVKACLEQVPPGAIEAISFSGHMSAPVLIDGAGAPVLPSILIADIRSGEETRFLRERYMDRMLILSGNEPVDAFAAPKLLWVAKHRPEAMKSAATLLFPKDYIRYKLTGEAGTEPTDAGNSLLYDRRTGAWAADLIEELGLRESLFPPIFASGGLAGAVGGEAARLTGLTPGTPVYAGGADMACSQLGTGAVQEGTFAVTLSTSGQAVLRVNEIEAAGRGRVTFHPSAEPGGLYAMGTVFTGGLGMDWGYRTLTGKPRLDAADYEALNALSGEIERVPAGSGGLMFLPFLTGSGSPYFDSRDRASWLGLSTGQSDAAMLHSIMEGVAYNIRESMDVFAESGHAIRRVHLGGGGSRNPVWRQIIADVLGKDVALLENRDASAVGAAVLAGVGAGTYESAEAGAAVVVRTGKPLRFRPERHERYNRLYTQYRKVYLALNAFYREAEENEVSM